MAKFKYFTDLNGETIELTNVYHDGAVSTAANHFFGIGPDGGKLQATRVIEYKAFPSKHKCDSRCTHATGKIMRCECSCGGKNHGKGG